MAKFPRIDVKRLPPLGRWKSLFSLAAVTLVLSSSGHAMAQEDISVLQQATSGHPITPHDNPLGYSVPLLDAYLSAHPTPAWTIPGEELKFLSYSPIGLTVYERYGLPRIDSKPLQQASSWALLWGGAGLIAGTAMWMESGAPSSVTRAALAGTAMGAPLGFLLGTAETSFKGLTNGRLLPDNVRITLTAVQLEHANDPISRPSISYAVMPALVGEFF